MADQDRPNQNANKAKAEGERGDIERNYPKDDADNAGGITNRPLSDEVESQQQVPERGQDVLNRSTEERYDTPRRYEEEEQQQEDSARRR